MLYSPGDTRMLTVFRMLHRILYLRSVCVDMMSRPAYETASQKALKAWSEGQAADDRLTRVNGLYIDKIKHTVIETDFYARVEGFITATKSALFLHRLVDGQTPVLGKFYYACALVDKHLRVCKQAGTVAYIDLMRSIFMKRWKRWHRPVHTFAYAVDPCYQEHELTVGELHDCNMVAYPSHHGCHRNYCTCATMLAALCKKPHAHYPSNTSAIYFCR